jgi:hypothetical protein
MPSRRTHLALVATLLALALPAAAQDREKARSVAAREEIEAVEAQLARAVDRVSLPHAARLLGRVESARGYRLPGYGIVLVLTPRMLPGGEGQIYVLRGGGPKHRRVRVESRRPATGEPEGTADDEEIETFERQVLVLQHETEVTRRAAEEEMERIVQDVRVRVAPRSEVRVEVHAAAPEANAPPAPPQAPVAPAPPSPAEPPQPPAPPPWKFWFETGTPEEKRAPEAVVADVRGVVIDALAAQGGRLVGLAGDERITVAVDFVPGGLFAAQARPGKTLVVTVRVKDVDARARGAITPEELRRRVEVTEY